MATQTLIPQTTITFPEITLHTRDAHKLRGYFGELFRNYSPLLHNHLQADNESATEAIRFRYAYPLVQYKVLRHMPTLVGFGEGAELLTQLFLQVSTLSIDGKHIPVHTKHIRCEQVPIGMADELVDYQFVTLWMALNQANYSDYRRYSEADRTAQLKRVFTSQILATFRTFGLWLTHHDRLMVHLSLDERATQFKNQRMIAFSGRFLANVVLPNGLGLGKGVSRGFGSVERCVHSDQPNQLVTRMHDTSWQPFS
ncbi:MULTISPECIES: CRISPR-associated endonuclease Cas6 [unclassified Spirosoma]|uniref:CRISPR-associated endonuclease Cas6 n=1 Tax=unclassified Spirosoma TaxID=2621999 RepID=UPI0009630404|nr:MULTISPECIES: CRISPR-associated endonuclease Cas6 [unclassified Spirosoma]MBN8822915.1 DNA repair protein [Spirosoma sp.]OJW80164.1 MAG: DNA repair protein [Spirosoma sp. 48-14]